MNPDLAGRIRPYIGGEEILSDPEQRFHRYVMLLSDLQDESDLNKWPELRDIVRLKVKPERDALGSNPTIFRYGSDGGHSKRTGQNFTPALLQWNRFLLRHK